MTCPICDQKPANCDCTAEERRQYGEIEDLEYEVERLRAERRWIPVEERLPEDNVDVLVRRKTACGMRSVAAYRSSGRDCWTITDGDYSEFYDHSVTHWMPLPEPPEVK